MLIQMLGGVDLVVEQGFAATCVRSEGKMDVGTRRSRTIVWTIARR